MRLTFKTTRPAEVELTLSMTAPVSEWRQLRDALSSGMPEARELGMAVGRMIGTVDATLASDSWATSMATGTVKEKP